MQPLGSAIKRGKCSLQAERKSGAGKVCVSEVVFVCGFGGGRHLSYLQT